MPRNSFWFAGLLAAGITGAMVVLAGVYDLPMRDPDGATGPTYVLLPAILLLAFLTDVVPRALNRADALRAVPRQFWWVTRERWQLAHVRFALTGLGAWYLTYVSFRNLKSYVPFVNPHLWDEQLGRLDRWLLLGHDPAVVLHNVLGTGWAAHVLSLVYLAWIVMVPASLVVALVWSRNRAGGAWYVTAVAVDWVLGVATYFAVPTVGPIYARPGLFLGLPDTWVSHIQAVMLSDRQEVLADPFATHAVQTIAAFASLHVAIMVTMCLMAHLLRLPPVVRTSLWVFLGLTELATVYLGWHYLVDTLAGAVIGAAAVWVAAVGTGNRVPARAARREPRGLPQPAAARETVGP